MGFNPYRDPYRYQPEDNPADWGRVTMPKGTLLTTPPGGPSTVGAGALGAYAGPGVSPSVYRGSNALSPTGMGGGGSFTPASGPAPYTQIWPAIANYLKGGTTTGYGVTAANAASAQNRQAYLTQGQQMTAYYQARLPYLQQQQGAGTVTGTDLNAYGERRAPGGDMTIYGITKGADIAMLASKNILPGAISVDLAQQTGNLQDLLAIGYTEVNGVLMAPASVRGTGTGTGTGGGGGESTTRGLFGPNDTRGRYGHAGDKWVTSDKAAASYYRRKSRNGDYGNKKQQDKQKPGAIRQAFGLVDFNASAG